jgi:hypothetical protein
LERFPKKNQKEDEHGLLVLFLDGEVSHIGFILEKGWDDSNS